MVYGVYHRNLAAGGMSIHLSARPQFTLSEFFRTATGPRPLQRGQLARGFLKCPQHRIHAGLIPRPLNLEPL